MKELVERSIGRNEWGFGNKVLYDLCSSSFKHDKPDAVIAKIWLIGRSYAAAIERRKNKSKHANEDFYLNVVAPKILESDIDQWFSALNEQAQIDDQLLEVILDTHAYVTELFKDISGLEKRSLASKYLHFHFPNLFFIYDARAVSAMSKYADKVGKVSRSKYPNADNEYRKFVEKCLKLRAYIKNHFDHELTPRQLDNLLLMTFASN